MTGSESETQTPDALTSAYFLSWIWIAFSVKVPIDAAWQGSGVDITQSERDKGKCFSKTSPKYGSYKQPGDAVEQMCLPSNILCSAAEATCASNQMCVF